MQALHEHMLEQTVGELDDGEANRAPLGVSLSAALPIAVSLAEPPATTSAELQVIKDRGLQYVAPRCKLIKDTR